MLRTLSRIRKGRPGRASSWNTKGLNADAWKIEPGETRALAEIDGPGVITHIWMTQTSHYRECLLRFTWDDARHPSVLCPLGDFFGLGHGIVNSYQSWFFSASTKFNNRFNRPCALNCYLPMPFRTGARIELINESKETHGQYFYIDYERFERPLDEDEGYFHAEFRRQNPFGGWGSKVKGPQYCIRNKERLAWDTNYVILEAKGRGHYVGCNQSVTNLVGGWWGEGDDMIWVDGYKWPPDLHGTGSEDFFNQAWGMQPNAHLRNGSSVWEEDTEGYQCSYVFHVENPVRFEKEIKVTIEAGHGNHLRNEIGSVAYWYGDKPRRVATPPPVRQRAPIMKDRLGAWAIDKRTQTPPKDINPNAEMKGMIAKWNKAQALHKKQVKEVYGR